MAIPGAVPDVCQSDPNRDPTSGSPRHPAWPALAAPSTVSSRGCGRERHVRPIYFRLSFPLTGDTSVIARVDSLQDVDPWAQAGLMIRESLAPNANHAYVLASAGSGVVFRSRKSTKAGTNQAKPPSGGPPAWLKLERAVGVTFTASYSADGVTLVARGLGEAAVRSVRARRAGRGQPQPVRQHDGRPVERVDRRPRCRCADVERCANRDADLACRRHLGPGAGHARTLAAHCH